MLPFLRLILAGVFALAGVTKLLDLRGARRSMEDFGVPRRLIAPAAIALPLAELLTALALLPQATALYGAGSAAVLLAGFTGAVGLQLLRGRRPDCHCFGQLHSQPVGWPVLARNGVLFGMALFVILTGWPDGGQGVGAWLLSLSPAARTVVAVAGIGIAAWAARAIVRTRAAHEAPMLVPDWTSMAIPVGAPAPEFSLAGLDGGVVTLSHLRARGKPVVLIFSDPGCNPCSALLPDIAGWQREHGETLTVAVVSRGTPEANRAKLADLAIEDVLLQEDREVAQAFGVLFTPGAVLVGADGAVGSAATPGEAAVRALIAEAAAHRGVLKPARGSMAPEFSLPDLESHTRTLLQFRGQSVVLLFWDPGCTHCQPLLGQIRFWEARSLDERPHLLVVSRGDVPANAAQGFSATVVLDQPFAVGRRYGVTGTPSAVLIDADGRIASDVAVGGAAILELIGQPNLAALSSGASQVAASEEGALPPATLPSDARPLRQDCVHDEMLADGSVVLFNGCRQQVVTLNPTAALVWEYCDGEHDIEAIINEIGAVFPSVPRPDADVRAMLDSFLQTGLIVAPPPAGAAPPRGTP